MYSFMLIPLLIGTCRYFAAVYYLNKFYLCFTETAVTITLVGGMNVTSVTPLSQKDLMMVVVCFILQ